MTSPLFASRMEVVSDNWAVARRMLDQSADVLAEDCVFSHTTYRTHGSYFAGGGSPK
jgi:hypothetical protein